MSGACRISGAVNRMPDSLWICSLHVQPLSSVRALLSYVALVLFSPPILPLNGIIGDTETQSLIFPSSVTPCLQRSGWLHLFFYLHLIVVDAEQGIERDLIVN